MVNEPRVTIGLPISNQLDTFEDAIRSVFAQTYESWELVVMLDGSPQEIVDRVQAIDDVRVRVEVRTENRGLAFRLNEITHLARGEFVARMDADDLMHRSRIEAQVRYFDEFPETDALGTHATLIDEHGAIRGALSEPALPSNPAGYLQSHALTHPTVMFRTGWARLNPYDSNFFRAEDKELWARTCRSAQFAKLGERLFFYRVNSDPDVKKQAASSKYDRRVIRVHGPALAGTAQTSLLLIRSFLLQGAYGMAARLGQSERLYRRHGVPLSDDERAESELLLLDVARTEVNGWAEESKACD